MAFTNTLEHDNVWGSRRLQIYKVTADGAEANISTAFSRIDFVSCQPEKGQTMPAIHMNANSTNTVANGTIGVSATSSGNIFRMLIVGS
jgi:hypothetical protein